MGARGAMRLNGFEARELLRFTPHWPGSLWVLAVAGAVAMLPFKQANADEDIATINPKAAAAIQAVKQLCLSGAQFDLKADVSGNLTLVKLAPGAQGSVSVNVRKSEGAAAIFDEKIRKIADDDTRNCMKPYIKRIVDAILGQSDSSTTVPGH